MTPTSVSNRPAGDFLKGLHRSQRPGPDDQRSAWFKIVDYGWLFLIAQPLFWALTVIHGFWVTGAGRLSANRGDQTALLPPLGCSYRSMARMRKLQPKLVQLREHMAMTAKR